MKKAFLLLIISCSTLWAHGQVTGNVKLVDINGDTLIDNSGIKVYFEASSVTAVTDSTYTSVNGDYSINLAAGSYLPPIYSKQGYYIDKDRCGCPYAGPHCYCTYTGPTDIVPNWALHQEIPVMPVAGVVSGEWPGNIEYRLVDPQDTIFVLAGDTLSIEGDAIVSGFDSATTIASGQGGIQTTFVVRGTLIINGTPEHPVNMGYTRDYGGFSDKYGGLMIFTENGGDTQIHGIVAKTSQPNAYSFTNATGEFQNIDSSITNPIIDRYPDNYFGITADNSTLLISETLTWPRWGEIQLNYGSKAYISCSVLPGTYITVGDDASLFITNTSGLTSIVANNFDTVSMVDCYLGGFGQYTTAFGFTMSNTSSVDSSVVIFQNNFIDYLDQSIGNMAFDGYIKLFMTNNLYNCAYYSPLTINDHVNTDGITYNYLYGGEEWGTYQPYFSGTNTPTWALSNYSRGQDPLNPISIDTLDSHGNRYFWHTDELVSDIYGIYEKDSTGRVIGIRANLDSLITNAGNPNIIDPDATRSDMGARDIYGCIFDPLPNFSQPIIAVADSVFPGDANHNQICNNMDLLPIGVYYGDTGTVRPNASLTWVGQDCPDWSGTQANGQNTKHVDCNGDGLVDSTDRDAIYLNYGLTHNVPKRSFGEGLWFQFPIDSIFEGDTIEVGIMLGRNLSPINNIYGIAFTVNYDSAFIVPGSAHMTFDPCWVGIDSVNMISLFREDTTVQRYDMALARTDGQNVSGSGQIGTLSVVMNDDIQAKLEGLLTTQMTYSDILAINNQEQHLQIGGEPGTFNVLVGYDHQPNAIVLPPANPDMLINLYPNPNKGQLNLQNSTHVAVNIELYNLAGKKLLQTTVGPGSSAIDLGSFELGLYLVRVYNNQFSLTRKISITE